MPVLFRGEISGIRTGEFDKKKYAVLQFAEKAEDDAMRFIEVNLPDDTDSSIFKVGQQVEFAMRISAKDKKIYYRALPPLVPPASGGARATTPPKA